MKTNDKTRRITNPEFDGIAATPRSRLLHYLKARPTLHRYSRVRHCLPSVFNLELQNTPLHPTSTVGPTCLGSPNLTTTSPTRYPNPPNTTYPSGTTFFSTALLLLFRTALPPESRRHLPMPLPLPHPNDITLSQPRESNPRSRPED